VSGTDLTGALAELVVAIGSFGQAQKQAAGRPRVPWESCHPVGPIGGINLITGGGTVNLPDLTGPHDPYWWDLRRFAAWGFTAGTVNLFKNDVNGSQLGSLAAPGNITWSAQELLGPRDHLIIVAAGITGTVEWEIRAVEVESRWLPEYLM
jgi:hypothetical protein